MEDSASGTINGELVALSHLFTRVVEWKWIDYTPARLKRLTEGEGRITYLITDQIRRNAPLEHVARGWLYIGWQA